jgi:pyruvate formate lyase activating enzyme
VRVDRRRLLTMASCGAAGALLCPRWAAARPGLTVGETVPADELPAREASWYKKLEGNRVECQLCPQGCKVADAERGTCGNRENRAGTYHTLVHSLACSIHVDPVEKKPFFHVLPGQQAFSFATAGCNVECKFCQNWEISQFRPEQVQAVYLPPEELARFARRSGATLTSATYSEPVVFWEYVRDSAKAARAVGLKTTIVSNGFIQEQPLREVLPLLDAVKVDLKSFRDQFYREQVRGKLEPVLKALEVIHASTSWLEIVVLLVPTLNDSEAEVRDLARWVKAHLGPDVPVHFTRFHPTYRLTNLPPTPVETLERSWRIGREEGLNFVYLGNLPGHQAESTACPGCGQVVIRRVGFQVLANDLKGGKCPACGRAIPGVWA